MTYTYGNWKKSTLNTLERLKKANDEGKKPKASYFNNGAVATWLSIFKENGEVTNGDGYQISEKGLALIEELKKRSFKVARGPRTYDLVEERWRTTPKQAAKTDVGMKIPDVSYFIEIKGPNGLHIAKNPTKVITKKIMKLLTEAE